ncbi:unnamed protein product [Cochlearia groenlandica]
MADDDFNEFDDIEKDKGSSVVGDYGDIAAVESDKLCEDGVFKKKSKKKHKTMGVVSVDVKKKKKKKKIDSNREKGKRKRDDNDDDDLGAETDERKSHKKKKKKKKKPSVDLEVEESSLSSPALDSNKKRKEKKKKKKKELSDDSKAEEKDLNSTKEENKEMESEDSEVEKNNNDFTKDANKEKKKMKQMDDIEAEEKDLNSTKDAKKKKQSEDSEVEENNKDSTKDANREKKKKKKQMDDIETEEKDLNSTKDAKKKKKKKQSEDSEVEKDAKKKKKRSKDSEVEEDANKKKKKKQKLCESDKDVTTPSSKSSKKVKFSDKVEIFPSEDETNDDEEEEEVEEAAGLVRGKRFTKEEDALLKQAVLQYIDNHALGDEGLQMVLHCKAHPKLKGCWKEIASAIPWRPYTSIYYRAHTVFEAGSKGVWTEEDLELVKEFQKKHGNDWRTLADAMGKHRIHVKDAWRRIRLNMNKGHWSREEYQSLFDLVNKDIKMKAFKEKHSKHGMLRDNIPWMAISDKLGTRNHSVCCLKWYDQLVSPMVAKGIWANVDDYRLLEELMKLDAACIDDVEWDNLLENRDGEACRKRWNQMVQHIGIPGSKTFAEQVEILSERYCPELAEDREDFDNRPYDPED